VFAQYESERRRSDTTNEFIRASGRFDLTARGKVNSYALFGELAVSLTRKNGRAGVVLPTGIATDASTAPFFASLVERKMLVGLTSFENEDLIFPSVHHAFKFCLLVVASEPLPTDPGFCFFLRGIQELGDSRRCFTLSRDDILRINPDTKTVPIFRTKEDAKYAAWIYAVAARDARPAGWISLKQNVFTSSNENDLAEFVSTRPSAGDRVQVYRGSMFHQYDHVFAQFNGKDFTSIPTTEKPQLLFAAGSDKSVSTSYYEERLDSKGIRPGYHLAIRRIARSTDERTMIAAILPVVGTDDTASVIVVRGTLSHECALLANLNSLILDYACSHKVGGTDIRKHNFEQLPILGPGLYSKADLAFVVPRVLELSYFNPTLRSFAQDLGYDGVPFPWVQSRRDAIRAELDAWYFRAYGFTRDDVRYILDPTDLMGANYPSGTFRVLQETETAAHGEYYTRRLVLEAWDRMERGELSGPEPFDERRSAPGSFNSQDTLAKSSAAGQGVLEFSKEPVH
jgi:hypothetical protein